MVMNGFWWRGCAGCLGKEIRGEPQQVSLRVPPDVYELFRPAQSGGRAAMGAVRQGGGMWLLLRLG